MKTHPIHSLTQAITLTLTAALLLLAACQDKKTAAQQEGTSAPNKVLPPPVDIHTAVVTGNLPALKQHIAAGTDVNEKDPYGESSPLITAALFGKTPMAQALLDAGADVNFQNKDGSTALHTAAFFCRPQIVQLLLDKGADKTIKNNYGVTAYQSVTTPFSEAKTTYEMMEKILGPMGLQLDYAYLEKTRPHIAALLK